MIGWGLKKRAAVGPKLVLERLLELLDHEYVGLIGLDVWEHKGSIISESECRVTIKLTEMSE